MKTHFLKVRMVAPSYERLKERAAESGKPISTFANLILEQENSITDTAIQLTQIKSQLQELSVLIAASKNQPPAASEMLSALIEIRLITRELAMDRNAQILSRVSAQIKSQQLGAK